jgi:hypothetical protein
MPKPFTLALDPNVAFWGAVELLPFVPTSSARQKQIANTVVDFAKHAYRMKSVRRIPATFAIVVGLTMCHTRAQYVDPFQAGWQPYAQMLQFVQEYYTAISDWYRPVNETFRQYQQIKQAYNMASRLMSGNLNQVLAVAMPLLDLEPDDMPYQAGDANNLKAAVAKDWVSPKNTSPLANEWSSYQPPTFQDVLAGLLMQLDRASAMQSAEQQLDPATDGAKILSDAAASFNTVMFGMQRGLGGFRDTDLSGLGQKFRDAVGVHQTQLLSMSRDKQLNVAFIQLMDLAAIDPDGPDYAAAYANYMQALAESGSDGGSIAAERAIQRYKTRASTKNELYAKRYSELELENAERIKRDEEVMKNLSIIGNTYNTDSSSNQPSNGGATFLPNQPTIGGVPVLSGGAVAGGVSTEPIGNAQKQTALLEALYLEISDMRKQMIADAKERAIDKAMDGNDEIAADAQETTAEETDGIATVADAKTISDAEQTIANNSPILQNNQFYYADAALDSVVNQIMNMNSNLDPVVAGGIPTEPLRPDTFEEILNGTYSGYAPQSDKTEYLLMSGNDLLQTTASQDDKDAAVKAVQDHMASDMKTSIENNMKNMPDRMKLIFEGSAQNASIGFLNPLLKSFYNGINHIFGDVFNTKQEIALWSGRGTLRIDYNKEATE